MNWHIALAALSGVLEACSLTLYLRSMVRGQTRPNAVSFGIWSALQAVALVAQLKAGASWSAIMVGGFTLSTMLITALALLGYGYRHYGPLDKVCLMLAAMAIVAWQVTGNPVNAIILAIVGDMCAIIPTAVKTHRDPHSEDVVAWALVALSALFGALSTELVNAANLAFPIYLTIGNGLIFALAYFGQKRAR